MAVEKAIRARFASSTYDCLRAPALKDEDSGNVELAPFRLLEIIDEQREAMRAEYEAMGTEYEASACDECSLLRATSSDLGLCCQKHTYKPQLSEAAKKLRKMAEDKAREPLFMVMRAAMSECGCKSLLPPMPCPPCDI